MNRFTFEPVDPDRDGVLLHRWITHPRAVFWLAQDASVDDIRDEHRGYQENPHHSSWLGNADGRPACLVETYDPLHTELGGLPEVRSGDLGMHLLVAPPDGQEEPDFTSEVFRAVMEFCSADPAVARIVVEPDVTNTAIRAKNLAAGFVEVREVALAQKVAMLSTCTRRDFESAAAADHLNPRNLEQAQRRLIAKAIAEYAHERLIAPTGLGGQEYRLDVGASVYTFSARRHLLDHWVVDPTSLARRVEGAAAVLDAQDLIAELAPALGIPGRLLPIYLEEIASTLAAGAWKHARSTITCEELVAAVGADSDPATGFQLVESAMTEGHPGFVANNGRIGFGIDDYHRHAPETGTPVRLEWLAVRRTLGSLSLADGVTEEDLCSEQLGATTVQRFRRRLQALDVDPDEYFYLPVHPWQWRNKLAITFAPDVGRRDLVHLGEGDDDFLAQQSIRTFFNASRPERHYVKVALSIQNMGFMRGLSPAYMVGTPAINDWVAETVHGDPVLQAHGFRVLREVATAGYTGDAYHRHTERSGHQKMIAALWRESPISQLGPGERVVTMASLLHRDRHGTAFATSLIKASPLDAVEWVHKYLRSYLVPVVHCLYAYDMVFMPHGENLVMVLRDHVPVRMFMKDIGEEVAVMGDIPLPVDVERIRHEVPADVQALSIHTDVIDGFLRHLAAILDDDGVLSEREFWAIARAVVEDHHRSHPEFSEAAERFDLFCPEFRHSCLNRLQLRNTLEMVDITDQAESLLFAGTLQNPLALAASQETGERTPSAQT